MSKFDEIAEGMLNEASGDWEVYQGTRDNAGELTIIRGRNVGAIAKAFGIKSDDWELEKIGKKLWAAYDGDRVTIMTDPSDFIPNEEY